MLYYENMRYTDSLQEQCQWNENHVLFTLKRTIKQGCQQDQFLYMGMWEQRQMHDKITQSLMLGKPSGAEIIVACTCLEGYIPMK